MTQLPPDYDQRVYAGWLGKCIGVRFGAPLEGWTYKEIKDNLGAVEDYLPLPPGKIFKPDDDTAGPMIIIRALEDHGPGVSAAQVGDTYLNYVGDQHGTFWWGGYGISAEHTAYLNLAAGIPAPLSGSLALNGAAMAESIGGQIFSDIWGLVAPNNPALAADYAARASSVSHDGNGIYGGMFIAALTSLAFAEREPRRLIERALAVIPADSEYARVVRAMLDFHAQEPHDWHAAYGYLHEHFGYQRYPGAVPIIPNAGVVVMALLYGQGDFSRSIQIANMAGWDTDCNVGNVGAIMGVAVGLDGIPARWREPMNDVLVTAGVIGVRNLLDIAGCADLFCRLGRQIAGEPPTPPKARYHFDYPGSRQGFGARSSVAEVVGLRQVPTEGGCLQVSVRGLNKKGEVRVFVRTHLRVKELSANYYGASFSPKIYPGQEMRARLRLDADAAGDVLAALYVWDDNHGHSHQATGTPLRPGQWQEITYRIPEMSGACLSEAGIVLRNVDVPWSGSLLLDDVHWGGRPCFSYDFSRERPEAGAISQWTYLRGLWRLEDGAYHGSGAGINESYSGDIEWRDYTLSVRLVPLVGDYHNINVRVQGALRSYAVGLAPNDTLVLYKNAKGYRPVVQAPLAWQHGQAVELSVSADGNRLTVRAGDTVAIEWVDDDQPYLNGQIGLSNFAGCCTRFEAVRVH